MQRTSARAGMVVTAVAACLVTVACGRLGEGSNAAGDSTSLTTTASEPAPDASAACHAPRELTDVVSRALGGLGPQGIASIEWAEVDGASANRLVGDEGASPERSVILVTLTGSFVCGLCRVPPGAPAPEGPFAGLFVDPETFEIDGTVIQHSAIDVSEVPDVGCIAVDAVWRKPSMPS